MHNPSFYENRYKVALGELVHHSTRPVSSFLSKLDEGLDILATRTKNTDVNFKRECISKMHRNDMSMISNMDILNEITCNSTRKYKELDDLLKLSVQSYAMYVALSNSKKTKFTLEVPTYAQFTRYIILDILKGLLEKSGSDEPMVMKRYIGSLTLMTELEKLTASRISGIVPIKDLIKTDFEKVSSMSDCSNANDDAAQSNVNAATVLSSNSETPLSPPFSPTNTNGCDSDHYDDMFENNPSSLLAEKEQYPTTTTTTTAVAADNGDQPPPSQPEVDHVGDSPASGIDIGDIKSEEKIVKGYDPTDIFAESLDDGEAVEKKLEIEEKMIDKKKEKRDEDDVGGKGEEDGDKDDNSDEDDEEFEDFVPSDTDMKSEDEDEICREVEGTMIKKNKRCVGKRNKKNGNTTIIFSELGTKQISDILRLLPNKEDASKELVQYEKWKENKRNKKKIVCEKKKSGGTEDDCICENKIDLKPESFSLTPNKNAMDVGPANNQNEGDEKESDENTKNESPQRIVRDVSLKQDKHPTSPPGDPRAEYDDYYYHYPEEEYKEEPDHYDETVEEDTYDEEERLFDVFSSRPAVIREEMLDTGGIKLPEFVTI